MIRTMLAVLLVLGGVADVGDLTCPQPDEPNCGEANGAGGWDPEVEVAPPADPVPVAPSFTG